MTVLELVDEVKMMTDAEQWLIVAAVALLVVVFTGYVGLAVCLVARAVVSIGRPAAERFRHSRMVAFSLSSWTPSRSRRMAPLSTRRTISAPRS
jgi:hypothetical protein